MWFIGTSVGARVENAKKRGILSRTVASDTRGRQDALPRRQAGVSNIDLRKLALRMKIVEMLRIYLRRKGMADARSRWRRLIGPN